MGERCIVIGAGFFDGLKHRPCEGDYIIAADGGFDYCVKSGIKPHLVVGDFDSLGHLPDAENVVQMPVEKDDTDMLHALRLGLERGCRLFEIYGGTGGARADHTIANLQCLLFLANRGTRGILYGEGIAYTAVRNGSLRFPPEQSGTVSVFCLDGEARGVTLRGLKYPLNNYTMRSDFPIGVSNSFTGDAAEISVSDGCLVIIYNI